MTRKELKAFIRQQVSDLAVDTLSGRHAIKKNVKPEVQMTEDDFDGLIFQEKKRYELPFYTIKEAVQDNPTVTSSEVEMFQSEIQEFSSSIGASIILDNQENGRSIILFERPDGVEAYCSGVLSFGTSGKIYWKFSLMEGLTIGTQNMVLEKQNRDFSASLYDFYDTWSQKWRSRLMTGGSSVE